MTVLQITPKPEPGESDSGCCTGGAVCGCSPEQLEDRGQAAVVEVGGELRTSSYIIYVDLPDNDSDMLIVHGYTGAFDKVSRRIATFLRAKEDRRAPKPLYGDWAPSPV